MWPDISTHETGVWADICYLGPPYRCMNGHIWYSGPPYWRMNGYLLFRPTLMTYKRMDIFLIQAHPTDIWTDLCYSGPPYWCMDGYLLFRPTLMTYERIFTIQAHPDDVWTDWYIYYSVPPYWRMKWYICYSGTPYWHMNGYLLFRPTLLTYGRTYGLRKMAKEEREKMDPSRLKSEERLRKNFLPFPSSQISFSCLWWIVLRYVCVCLAFALWVETA